MQRPYMSVQNKALKPAKGVQLTFSKHRVVAIEGCSIKHDSAAKEKWFSY